MVRQFGQGGSVITSVPEERRTQVSFALFSSILCDHSPILALYPSFKIVLVKKLKEHPLLKLCVCLQA